VVSTPVQVELRDVHVAFDGRGHGWGLRRRGSRKVHAVNGVTLDVRAAEVLAIVGESGCGKTTTGHLMAASATPTSGSVHFRGRDVASVRGADRRRLLGQLPMIYQDPYESLDPRFTVEQTVGEPLVIHHASDSGRRAELIAGALERVGLSPVDAYLKRLPHELSGGQRQRVAIAAAVVLAPSVIIADEPVSMLDMSVRAEVLGVFSRLRAEGVGIVMITHDIATAARYADRVAVMYLGRVVELGPARTVIRTPAHPYTRALIKAVPGSQRHGGAGGLDLKDGAVDATALPSGCSLHPRCPCADETCSAHQPTLEPALRAPDHLVACPLWRSMDARS